MCLIDQSFNPRTCLRPIRLCRDRTKQRVEHGSPPPYQRPDIHHCLHLSLRILRILLLLICIVCDSHMLGHDLTARRIVIVTNLATLVLGTFLIVVSFMNGYVLGHSNIALPYIAGGVGIFSLLVSSMGIVAVCRKRRSNLLCCYAFLMFALTTALIIIAVLAFQQRDAVKQWVDQHWSGIEENVIGLDISEDDFVRQLHQHLNLIGLSTSILACTLLFNTGAAVCFYMIQRKNLREDRDVEERKVLCEGSSEEEDMYEEEEMEDAEEGKDSNRQQVDVHIHLVDPTQKKKKTIELTRKKGKRGKKGKKRSETE